ncbi:MAG: 6-carboxytetrahydropterin synthase [Sulfolobaceae archaeon]
MKMRVGIEGITFDSAHYTLSSPHNAQIHGHTYSLSVELEGNVNPEDGFIIDFEQMKVIINEIVKKWDHKLIIPAKDYKNTKIEGPFSLELKIIEAPYPTAEYIILELVKEIYNAFNGKFKVYAKLYEGKDSYVFIEYP